MGEKAKYLLGLIVIAMFFYAKGIKMGLSIAAGSTNRMSIDTMIIFKGLKRSCLTGCGFLDWDDDIGSCDPSSLQSPDSASRGSRDPRRHDMYSSGIAP